MTLLAAAAALAFGALATSAGASAQQAAGVQAAAAHARAGASVKPDYKRVCPVSTRRGVWACMALIRTNVSPHMQPAARPDSAPSGDGYGPSDLQSAYNLPSGTAGSGETVAVVDAYDDPNVVSDLAAYRSAWGLPACTIANGCLSVVNQDGQASPLPPNSPAGDDWSVEESLDLDMVSAVCPLCHIIVVEADDDQGDGLLIAQNTAVSLGASFISDSWGGAEYSSETSDETAYFKHPGVAITASAGDAGYGVSFPAASQYVTSVGGTSLTQDSSARGWTESVWGSHSGGAGTGSGCSAYEPKPSWQTDTGCSQRTDNDVAAVADPNTGVAIYDTDNSDGGWIEVGGTSASSPIIASVFALAGTPDPGTYPSSYIYQHVQALYDVTSGSDGSCSPGPPYWCTAGAGYDGPTGWGTPDGTAAFTAPPLTKPGAPGTPSATAGNAQAAVSFSPPGSDGGSPITSYTVTATDTTNAGNGGQTASGAASPITVTGLTNGDSYTFTVTATNAVGTGPPSGASNPVTPAAVPGAPGTPSATAGNAQAAVSFSPPGSDGGSPITSYTVTATDLTNGDSYTFTVTATNAVGTGPPSGASNPVTPAAPGTVPGAPVISVGTGGNAQATVAFTPPRGDGSNPITSYTVTAIDTTNSANGGQTASGAASPITVTGLTNGDSYTFTVTATNNVGTGPSSPASNPVIPALPGHGTADLSIAVSGPASAADGSTFTEKLTVTNHGSSRATSILSELAVPKQVTVTADPGGFKYNSKVYWTKQSLAAHSTVTYTITFKAGAAGNGTALIDVATVSLKIPDPTMANNVAVKRIRLG